jgi:FdrA protein
MEGIEEAAFMMGSPRNREVLESAGMLNDEARAAGPNDLVIAIKASSEHAARTALAAVEEMLVRPQAAAAGNATAMWRPRTLRSAVTSTPDAKLALISVPGEFAAAEALKALRYGLHAMIFSDNVAIEEEVAIKTEARDRGLLVMGPDCGTAIVNGLPLGFANHVPRGSIGVIGASGTGIQEVVCLIARGGGGISHALGVGSRDLSEAVGGISTAMALGALDHDRASECIVLISKPPSAIVMKRLLARLERSSKRVVACLLGAGDVEVPDNVTLVPTLKLAAEAALGAPLRADFEPARCLSARSSGGVVGLFTGGTLCAEAQLIFLSKGKPVASNAPVPGAAFVAGLAGAGHLMIDLGADEYTHGRPHPMIDPSARDENLKHALHGERTAAVLLDVVIGYGAHGDPAGHIVHLLDARPEHVTVIASVTGTDNDPQVRSRQVDRLEAAGVVVAPSNAQAAELAAALATMSGE